ncbi:MAG: hypothetical protein N5P05_002242 [Chroococcopsis gigantea SAG 12.99]|nr:hypothetical protein [Chroococcopsis gigantea SAG 12.99]
MVSNYSQELPYEDVDLAEGLNKKGLNLAPYIRVLKRKAWLIGALTTLGALGGFAWGSTDPSTYIGNFYLLVEPITPSAKLSDPTTLARTSGVPQEDLFALDYPTNLAFLQSPGMTYRIANDVYQKQKSRPLPAIWKDIRENLKVDRVGETRATATKIFSVTFTGTNPKEVQRILDTASETFLRYSAEDRETSLKAGVKFIDKQLPSLQKRLSALLDKQENLREKNELLDPQAKGQQVLDSVGKLQEQQLAIESELKAQKSIYNSLQKQLNLTPTEAIASSSINGDPNRASLVAKLQEIDNQIALQKSQFTDNSPVMQNLLEQRDNINKLLQKATQNILNKNNIALDSNSPAFNSQNQTKEALIQQMIEANNKIKALEIQKQLLDDTKNKLESQSVSYPEVIRQYQEIERQVVLTTDIINRLQTQRETLKVESAQELPWQLISKPQIPLDADGQYVSFAGKPTKKIAAGLGAGLLLSTALAFLLEKRRNNFYESPDVADATGVPLLGKIPWNSKSNKHLPLVILPPSHKDIEADNNQVQLSQDQLDGDKSFAFQTSFNSLYNQLFSNKNSSSLQSLAISSVEHGDGQTTTAVYLAKVAAGNGKKVLLVDANWFNPQVHKFFNISNDQGIYQILTEAINPVKVIQSSPNDRNLFLLTSGLASAEPQKGFWSLKMQELMKELEAQFDLIIYDLPHFYDSTDVGFVASHTDGLILVVALHKTSASKVKQASTEIKDYSIPCLGVVVNHLTDAPIPLL